MTRKKPVTWVRMGADCASCDRCGGQEPVLPLPLSFEAYLAYLTYVMEKHRYCEEPKS